MLRMVFARSTSQPSRKEKKEWLGVSFKPENFIPGLVIGFILGFIMDLAKTDKGSNFPLLNNKKKKNSQPQKLTSTSSEENFKMVLVVRQDLKMGAGKIASQCAHAATGMYSELMQSQRYLLRQWEQCGQAKIVLTCKNQQEMNRLKETAESIGLPTFVVADAGRTQVASGTKTVLAIGPGDKSSIDSVTGKLRLL